MARARAAGGGEQRMGAAEGRPAEVDALRGRVAQTAEEGRSGRCPGVGRGWSDVAVVSRPSAARG